MKKSEKNTEEKNEKDSLPKREFLQRCWTILNNVSQNGRVVDWDDAAHSEPSCFCLETPPVIRRIESIGQAQAAGCVDDVLNEKEEEEEMKEIELTRLKITKEERFK